MRAIKSPITDRGIPSEPFLNELITWGKRADLSIFDKNDVDIEIFTLIRPKLGPWRVTPEEPIPFIYHRRAALLEAMRVHAGYESSWNWKEGVDITNRTSMKNIEGQETGIFQVSYDSTRLGDGAMISYLKRNLITAVGHPQIFIDIMKSDHFFALDYYAHLVRLNIKWAGPLLHGHIIKDLNPDAVEEFKKLLDTDTKIA